MPSKRYRKALELVGAKKSYPLKSAVELLTKLPKAKFNETVDLAFRLGVDPKQSDQMIRATASRSSSGHRHRGGRANSPLVFQFFDEIRNFQHGRVTQFIYDLGLV